MDLFSQFLNNDVCFNPEFAKRLKHLESGDILEFGCRCGFSALDLARENPHRTVFTFDHFKGLEQSKQPIPPNSGWVKGAFVLGIGDSGRYKEPRTIDEVKQVIGQEKNIVLNVEDIHLLKDPSEYNISKIVAVNIDVDIYEPTVSSLNFVDKCIWNTLYIRFDDWHGHEPEYDFHERLACQEWILKNNYKFSVLENGSASCLIINR